MLEKANYEKVDTRKLVEVYMRAAKEKEEKFGPTYSATFIKNALGAVSTQTDMKASQEIKALDQLKEYLTRQC
jgi:ethanolamine utilization protein EutP (predicted NTPase)